MPDFLLFDEADFFDFDDDDFFDFDDFEDCVVFAFAFDFFAAAAAESNAAKDTARHNRRYIILRNFIVVWDMFATPAHRARCMENKVTKKI